MFVYFVRHGESKFNAAGLHQKGDVELSENGKKQAHFLAKRLAKLPVDQILSSPFIRAKQTAEIIQEQVQKPLIFLSSLVELKRPTEIEGRKVDDPDVVKIKEQMSVHMHEEHWHYSDEENVFDLKKRAVESLKHIEKLPSKHIVVVSHGAMLRMFFLIMLYGESADVLEFKRLAHFLHVKNTGITLCEFKNGNWKLISWNDHAHLG